MASKFSIESILRMTDGFTAPLKGVERSVTGFSKRTQNAFNGLNGGIQKFQNRINASRENIQVFSMAASGLSQAGSQLSAVGSAMLSTFTPIIEEGRNFEKAMSNVAAVSRLDKTSDQFKLLSEKARELGATTQYSARQAAEGMTFLAMAGFDAQQQISAMPGMLELATAGNIDLARAADIASNTLGAFKLSASEMGRVGNVLAATFTRSNTDLNMLAETFKYAGPVAKSAGVEIEDLAAMAGLLGDVGIQGSNAGTALRAALVRLTKQPKMAAKALRSLGIQTLDSFGNMRSMPQLLEDIRIKTQGMGGGLRLAKIAEIFGTEAAASFAELISKADKSKKSITDFSNQIKKATEANELSKIAATMADNFDGASKAFESARSELLLIAWDAIREPVTRLTKAITAIIQVVGNWARRNPFLVRTILVIISVLGVFFSIMGTLLTLGGMIAGVFAFMSMAAATFGITLSAAIWPITAIVGGIVLVGTVIALLIAYWDDIVEAIKGAITWFSNLFSSFPGWVQILLVVLLPVVFLPLLLFKYWGPIKEFFIKLFGVVKKVFNDALTFIKSFWNGLSSSTQNKILGLLIVFLPFIGIPLLIKTRWAELKTFFTNLFTSIKNKFMDVSNFFASFWNNFSSSTQNKILGLLIVFLPFIGIPLLIKTRWVVLKTFFLNLFSSIGNIVSIMIEGIKKRILSIKESIAGVIGEKAMNWLITGKAESPEKQVVTPASSDTINRAAVTSTINKETNNRSQVDVNFNNKPENVSVKQRGEMAPNTSLQLGVN